MRKKLRVETYRLNLRQRVERNIEKFKTYCYTSITSGLVMFILLFIFTSLYKIHYLFSFVIAFTISTTLSFVLNKYLVFCNFNPKKTVKLYKEFFVTSLVAFVVNFVALYVLVDIYHIYYLLAQLIIGAIGLPILFLIHKKMVFCHV